jgi:uncharacterized membrane protein
VTVLAPSALRRRLQHLAAAEWVLVAATVSWIAWMYLNVWRRHDRFGTFDNDLGFHSQYVWLLSRGKTFSSILGLPVFGHNATFGYFLLAPFAWLGGGPQFINFVQTVAVGLGVWPVYRLARRRITSSWWSVVLAMVYLAHPVVAGNVWETFHPEAMAMTPLLAALLAAEEGKWRRYAVFVLLALIWKTDVALFVVMLGIRVWRRHDRRVGIATLATGAVWFIVCVTLLIPGFSGGGTVFGPLYGKLGDTPFEVAKTGLRHPSEITDRLGDNDPPRYFRDLLAPYSFVPLLSPGSMALALPQYTVNLLAEPHFTRDPFDNPHYQALPAVALIVALLDTISKVRKRWRWSPPVVVSGVAVVAVMFAIMWSAIPIGWKRGHFWNPDHDPLRPDKELAIELVGPHDSVSATYLFVPHLTRRDLVYSFPNPWMRIFYGVESTKLPDPYRVQWLAVDKTLLSNDFLDVYNCVLDSGSFELVYQRDDSPIEVWRRLPGHAGDRACQQPS